MRDETENRDLCSKYHRFSAIQLRDIIGLDVCVDVIQTYLFDITISVYSLYVNRTLFSFFGIFCGVTQFI
jgi:hypothetical protein